MTVFFLLFSINSFTHQLDEISFKFYEANVIQKDHVFFSVTGMNRPVIGRLHSETGDLILCENNRFPLFTVDTMTIVDGELVVLDTVLKNFLRFDLSLNYLGKISLAEFAWGALAVYTPRFAHVTETGRILITFQSPEDRGQLALGTLDVRTRNIVDLGRKTIDDKQEGYWYPWNEQLLFIHGNLGRIDLTDPEHPGKTQRVLYPGLERPIEKRRFRRAGRPPYRWVLTYPNRVGETIIWVWNRFVDDAGEELEDPVFRDRLLRLSSEGLVLEETQQFPIAETENGSLIIDWDEPVLRWLPRCR